VHPPDPQIGQVLSRAMAKILDTPPPGPKAADWYDAMGIRTDLSPSPICVRCDNAWSSKPDNFTGISGGIIDVEPRK